MWGRKVGQGPKTARIRIQYPWSVAFRPIVSPSSLWWLFISIWKKKISARMISPKLRPLLHYVDADADRDSLFRVLLSLPVWLIWTPVVDFRPQPLPSLEYALFCSEDNATHLFIIRILIHCQRVGCLLLHCTALCTISDFIDASRRLLGGFASSTYSFAYQFKSPSPSSSSFFSFSPIFIASIHPTAHREEIYRNRLILISVVEQTLMLFLILFLPLPSLDDSRSA